MTGRVFDYGPCSDDYDVLLIAGPVFDRDFASQHGRLLETARRDGKAIVLASIGGRAYDAEERRVVRDVLSKVRPDIFLSRDNETFQAYSDLTRAPFNGICFAFFANDALDASGRVRLSVDEYIVSTFDFRPEPKLNELLSRGPSGEIFVRGALDPGRTVDRLSRAGFVLQRDLPAVIDGVSIVRPSQRPIRHRRFMFHKVNAFVDFSVWPYLNLYAGSSLTVTDRLHAAVATMVHGRPAKLALKSNRTKLFGQVPLVDNGRGANVLNMEALSEIKGRQLQFLGDSLAGLSND